MEILSFDTLPSTQKYLLEKIEKKALQAPVAVITSQQSFGVGSRDNNWSGGEGNFFASVAVELESLPADLSLSSASIYFSFIMKKTLEDLGENIWLKWPNDFYFNDEKIGGTITKKINLLKNIEDRLSENLIQTIQNIKRVFQKIKKS